MTGFYDVVPRKFGQVRNLNALSDNYGKQFENWNGVDVTVNAGCGTASRCRLASAPARRWRTTARSWRSCRRCNNQPAPPSAPNTASTLPASWRPAQFCHRESPFLTQFKAYGVYLDPEDRGADLRFVPQHPGSEPAEPAEQRRQGGVRRDQRVPGHQLDAGPAARRGRAERDAATPRAATREYLDRRNELDLRFGKVLRLGRGARATLSVDILQRAQLRRDHRRQPVLRDVPGSDTRS